MSEFIIAALVAFVAFFVGFAFWAAARLDRARKILRENETNPIEINARLERIERAVDAIAVEVERIGEEERFGAKIIAALPKQAPQLSPEGRVITPH